jgi:hypothetical protein
MPADFIVGAALGAVAASPRVRKAVRQGLVYGVGSVLVAFDKASSVAHGVAKDARQRMTGADKPAAAQPSSEPVANAAAPDAAGSLSTHPGA